MKKDISFDGIKVINLAGERLITLGGNGYNVERKGLRFVEPCETL